MRRLVLFVPLLFAACSEPEATKPNMSVLVSANPTLPAEAGDVATPSAPPNFTHAAPLAAAVVTQPQIGSEQ